MAHFTCEQDRQIKRFNRDISSSECPNNYQASGQSKLTNWLETKKFRKRGRGKKKKLFSKLVLSVKSLRVPVEHGQDHDV